MEISAQNTFKGTVKTSSVCAINTGITIEIAPSLEIVAGITKSSAERLSLAEGKDAYVVIKASDVMVAVD